MSRSSTPKVTRRIVWAVVQDGEVTGVSLRDCAICVTAILGIHPSCTRKTEEILAWLDAKHMIVLADAMLRPTTPDERATLQEARRKEKVRQRAIRRRTSAQRQGGHRHLPLAPPVVDQETLAYKAWVEKGLGVRAQILV